MTNKKKVIELEEEVANILNTFTKENGGFILKVDVVHLCYVQGKGGPGIEIKIKWRTEKEVQKRTKEYKHNIKETEETK